MKWSILTLVGADQPGIVAAVSGALFDAGCNLGQASMMRLGDNFAIMLRVSHAAETDLRGVLAEVCQRLSLHLHLDEDVTSDQPAVDPDVQVTVYGADRSGIVAQVAGALAEAGLNITDLESDMGGDPQHPIYVMSLEGVAGEGIEALQRAVENLDSTIEVNIDEISTLRA